MQNIYLVDFMNETEVSDRTHVLHSFFYVKKDRFALFKKSKERTQTHGIKIFLDSGAYSAFTKKIKVDIQEYIDFIKTHQDSIHMYSNLDDITCPVNTYKNQKIMEKAGLNPLPVFHYKENITYLYKYIEEGYEYLGLGGLVPIGNSDLARWLDTMFINELSYKDGLPKIKLHGFGLTSPKLMLRYPWYSVDSTAWMKRAFYGGIYIPSFHNGKFSYNENCFNTYISNRRNTALHSNYKILAPAVRKVIQDYLKEVEVGLGVSEVKKVPPEYKLQENEKWWNKEKTEVEVIKEKGVLNDGVSRLIVNARFFDRFVNATTDWPWAFKINHIPGFF